MITAVLTILILFFIIDRNISYAVHPDIKDKYVLKLIKHEAKARYVDAYASLEDDVSDLFDYLVNTTQLSGVVDLNNHRQFRHLITEAITATKYPNPSYKAEACFVFDFVMEAYHVVAYDFKHRKISCNLQKFIQE